MKTSLVKVDFPKKGDYTPYESKKRAMVMVSFPCEDLQYLQNLLGIAIDYKCRGEGFTPSVEYAKRIWNDIDDLRLKVEKTLGML